MITVKGKLVDYLIETYENDKKEGVVDKDILVALRNLIVSLMERKSKAYEISNEDLEASATFLDHINK